MKPLSVNRLAKSPQEAPSWFAGYAKQQNEFLKDLAVGLNKEMTLAENIRCQEFVNYTFRTASDYVASDTFAPLMFKKRSRNKIVHAQLTRIYETEAPGNIIRTNPGINGAWVDDGDNFVVRYVTGLQDSTAYTATFLVF